MSTPPVTLTIDGAVAELRVSGAIDLAWTQALGDHAAALRGNDGVRVVKLVGEGRFFCPGGDLGWMAGQADKQVAVHELATTLHTGLKDLAALDAPIVARVHGPAAGAGLSLVMAADIAIAADTATLVMAYAGVGLSPDGGSSWLLPRLVGRRRAAEIMMLNRPVKAPEAVALGLLTSAVPAEELDAAVDAVVQQLATGPTATYGAIKRLLGSSSQNDLDTQLDLEADQIAALAGSPTGAEGIAAFLEKRTPQF
jgi:2-(1,2-epoxy-1,2-dihydrophenyl)acetyl-CoA isomerase